jgi:hypothetical protein
VQTKTIEHSNDTNIVNKIFDALGQTLRDVEACLQLLPELSAADLQKFDTNTMAIPTGDITQGHDVTGALPQVILHRQPCACSVYCRAPVPHHLTPLLPALLSLLTRLAATAGPAGLLVIMDTRRADAAQSCDWLRQEVAGVPGMAGVRVSSLGEVRGTESGATLYIGDREVLGGGGLAEGASRVTGLLTLCSWPVHSAERRSLRVQKHQFWTPQGKISPGFVLHSWKLSTMGLL